VPRITPDEATVNPGGNPPLEDHEYGGVPPLAANCAAYEAPTVPVGRGLAVVMTSGDCAANVAANSIPRMAGFMDCFDVKPDNRPAVVKERNKSIDRISEGQ
jgi:hypothetical protein